jgi:hypothetical protein
MSRIDGRKIVGFAVAGTLAMLGVGQIYLPYIADRNQLRGLFEDEESLSEQAKLEIQRVIQAEHEDGHISSATASNSGAATGAPGSMWKNMKR